MLPRYRYLTLLLLLLVLLQGVNPKKPWAATAAMQKLCSDCHTMHNSQNGQPITTSSTIRYDALTVNSCVGCHSTDSPASQGGAGTTPFVWAINGAPTYGTSPSQSLAGGNFYWVSQAGGDLKGHNVEGIVAQTARVPPGNKEEAGGKTYDTLTCAGLNGCHGDTSVASQVGAIWGSHHSTQAIDGLTPPTSYRFLNGVEGYEDPDWEYSNSASDHNLYKAVHRIFGDDNIASDHTINGLCAKCHSDFHNDSGGGTGTAAGALGSPWIRHPVDIEMVGGPGTEYDYGSPAAGDYMVRTPLGTTVVNPLSNSGGPGTVVLTSGSGDAIITCITCHRAHGSKYDYSLRWDYRNWPGGALDGGCYDCHTTKN